MMLCVFNKVKRLFVLLIFMGSSLIPVPAHAMVLYREKEPLKTDTIIKKPSKVFRSPKTATLMALVPGLGQAYNRKYWKIPIIYAGFGVIGYFAVVNSREFKKYSNAYNCKAINPNCSNPISKKYSETTLRLIRDYYRRNMQLSYIVMGGWYLLQILDANVDAQLTHWNVTNNISMDVYPVIRPPSNTNVPGYGGIGLRLNF